MEHRDFLRLLVLFLGFSFVFSSVAVPPSSKALMGSLKFVKEDSSAQDVPAQDVMVMTADRELLEVGEGVFIEGRMDFESLDYPGTGANNHHDPKPPTRV